MEQNKQVMERFVEFINTGNMEIGREIIAPDIIFYAPTSPEPMTGLEGYAAVLDMMRGAMPDVHGTVEEQSRRPISLCRTPAPLPFPMSFVGYVSGQTC